MTLVNDHPYYDTTQILSYNAVWNFLVGSRGLGKTYGFKRKAIRDNIRKGHQFIYLRRYKPEIVASKQAFFADIEHEFPDWDFRVNGNTAERAHVATREDKKRQWEVMGFFVSLSTAQSLKGVSYHNVRTVIFDEFIIEKSHNRYLVNEADVMLNFFLTVDRNRDKTKVYFLANSVSIMNPYFIRYKIRPENLPEISTMHKGFILVHFPPADAFRESVSNTRWGQFIAGTEYEEYAVGNNFADANGNMLGLKPSWAVYLFVLETKHGTFAAWRDQRNELYYIQQKLPKSTGRYYTLLSDRMAEHKVLVTVQDKLMSYLRTGYRHGKVRFDNPESRNAFAELFNR